MLQCGWISKTSYQVEAARFHLYDILTKGESTGPRSTLMGCLGAKSKNGDWLQNGMKDLQGVMKMFESWIMVVTLQLCKFTMNLLFRGEKAILIS